MAVGFLFLTMPSSDFDFNKIPHEIWAALTGIGAALGWGKLIDYFSEGRRRRAAERVENEEREDKARADYQARLHEDWVYLREQLQQAEHAYRESEQHRMRIESELFKMREQLKVLQLKYDALLEEMESQQ